MKSGMHILHETKPEKQQKMLLVVVENLAPDILSSFVFPLGMICLVCIFLFLLLLSFSTPQMYLCFPLLLDARKETEVDFWVKRKTQQDEKKRESIEDCFRIDKAES